MIIRLRLKIGRPVSRKRGKNRHLAQALASLLMPVSVAVYALAAWRIAADIGVAGAFPFGGILSHWQVWLPLGILISFAVFTLNRYGATPEAAVEDVTEIQLEREQTPTR